jgi:hypothetical protein
MALLLGGKSSERTKDPSSDSSFLDAVENGKETQRTKHPSSVSTVVECLLRKVLPSLKDSFVDMGEDNYSSHIVQRLRNIRDELLGLVLWVTEK